MLWCGAHRENVSLQSFFPTTILLAVLWIPHTHLSCGIGQVDIGPTLFSEPSERTPWQHTSPLFSPRALATASRSSSALSLSLVFDFSLIRVGFRQRTPFVPAHGLLQSPHATIPLATHSSATHCHCYAHDYITYTTNPERTGAR